MSVRETICAEFSGAIGGGVQIAEAAPQGYDRSMPLRWHTFSLQTKLTCAIIVIVGLSVAASSYLDYQESLTRAKQNFVGEMLAVTNYLDATIPSMNDLQDAPIREAVLTELRMSRPELLLLELYAFPADKSAPPALVARSADVSSPSPEIIQPMLHKVRSQSIAAFDLMSEEPTNHLRIAAPVFVRGELAGASFAEFSSQRFDEALGYQHRLMLTRKLVMAGLIILTIYVFLFRYVHSPVSALLKAITAVDKGNLDIKASVYARDEIGLLAERFNQMVEHLRTTGADNRRLYEELQAAHRELELKVEAATAEILQKNRALARTNELLSTIQREAARTRRLSAIGQFAASVAHKIGTPLTALSGHVQLLEEDAKLSDEARHRVQTIAGQIERTSRIIQDLLLYTRKPDPVLVPMDINACMEECLALLRPEIDRRNVTLSASLNPGVGRVRGDQAQLHELFCSLVENALDAMAGGGTLRIKTAPEKPDSSDDAQGNILVEIADSGCGIEPAHVQRIFEPFFTTKKAGQGTGLGLAIAYEAVRAHGGVITVTSELGKGTTFAILLPMSLETT